MAFSNWVTNNKEGETVGPIFVPERMEISGVELKEAAGFGVTDLRLHIRYQTGITGGETQETGWLTNGEHHWIKSVFVSNDKSVIGIQAREQAGFGIVDLRLIYKNKNNTSTNNLFSEWVTKNDAGKVTEVIVPEGHYVIGVEGKEQAGYGLIDLRLVY